jgi:hypothetical protein
MNHLQRCLRSLNYLRAIERMRSGKRPSGEAHTHQMDDLGDTIIRERAAESQAAKTGTDIPWME